MVLRRPQVIPPEPGNGSLMRLAPVPLFYFGRPENAVALAGESSRTTHGTPVAVDACRYLAALITGALSGATKVELLERRYEPSPGYWDRQPLHPVIAAIADGSFRRKEPPEIRGTTYAAEALEAALRAFHRSHSFEEGALLAVNLGHDADTTGAIYGQIAGAYYGESGIPAVWRNVIARKELIDRCAESLFQLSFGGPELPPARLTQARDMAEQAIRDNGSAIRALKWLRRALQSPSP